LLGDFDDGDTARHQDHEFQAVIEEFTSEQGVTEVVDLHLR
jgi:hypothetical protein